MKYKPQQNKDISGNKSRWEMSSPFFSSPLIGPASAWTITEGGGVGWAFLQIGKVGLTEVYLLSH